VDLVPDVKELAEEVLGNGADEVDDVCRQFEELLSDVVAHPFPVELLTDDQIESGIDEFVLILPAHVLGLVGQVLFGGGEFDVVGVLLLQVQQLFCLEEFAQHCLTLEAHAGAVPVGVELVDYVPFGLVVPVDPDLEHPEV